MAIQLTKRQAIEKLSGNLPKSLIRNLELMRDEIDESRPTTHTQEMIQLCDKTENEIEYLLLTAEPVEQTVNLIGKLTIKLNILTEKIDAQSRLYKFLINKWRLFI